MKVRISKMSFVRSHAELREKLIRGSVVNWDYLQELRELDGKQCTHNFESAMAFVLKKEGVTTLESKGKYFIHMPGLGGSEPIIYGYVVYFNRENDIRDFAKIFYPRGLIARIEE